MAIQQLAYMTYKPDTAGVEEHMPPSFFFSSSLFSARISGVPAGPRI